MNEIYLSIIIPAYNERDRLPYTLDKLVNFLQAQAYTYEIIVVDDGSDDGTALVVQENYADQAKLIILPRNKGKGAAVKAGVLASVGQQVLFCDADGSTPIEELLKLQAKFKNGYRLAFGNRSDGSLVGQKQPIYRILLGQLFNKIVQLVLGAPVKDTQCGFKLLEGDLARELFAKMQVEGFAFDVELIYLAKKRKIDFAQVSVIWINDERSKVNIMRDPLVMFFELLKIKAIHF